MKWVDNDVVMNWYFETKINMNDKQVIYAQHRGYIDAWVKWTHYCKVVTVDRQGTTQTYYKDDIDERWRERL